MVSIVSGENLSFSYAGSKALREGGQLAVNQVSVEVPKGTAFGVVGESGSGKSTLIRLLAGLRRPTVGKVLFEGSDMQSLLHQDKHAIRRKAQMIFQNPRRSFDPRMRIGRSLGEPARALLGRSPTRSELGDSLESVGLSDTLLRRYPQELSGGQLQRIAIARALLPDPQVVFADEPTSSLDVSVQARVLNLLTRLTVERHLTLVIVSHNLAVIARVCDEIAVMQNGVVIESGSREFLTGEPESEYTAELLNSARGMSLRR